MTDEIPRWIAKIQSTLRFSRDHKPGGGGTQRAVLSLALITLFKDELRAQAMEIIGVPPPNNALDEYQQTAVDQFIYKQFLLQPKLLETTIDRLMERCSEMNIRSLKDLLAEAYVELKICQDKMTNKEKGLIQEILDQGSPDGSVPTFGIVETVFYYMQRILEMKSEAG